MTRLAFALTIASAAFLGWVACAWWHLETSRGLVPASFPQAELYRELAPCRIGPRPLPIHPERRT